MGGDLGVGFLCVCVCVSLTIRKRQISMSLRKLGKFNFPSYIHLYDVNFIITILDAHKYIFENLIRTLQKQHMQFLKK